VEALLLNQTKTDDILSKTDQLEDKINVSGHKTAQDIDALKNTMRQFNDRLSKLESQGLNPVPHPPTGSNDSASSKNVRDAKK
jgi:predicted  nucleic acid-binding Zn-ribbon protein